jgi:hypothetical protein
VFSSPSVRWLDVSSSHPYGTQGPFDGLSDHVPKLARLALPA